MRPCLPFALLVILAGPAVAQVGTRTTHDELFGGNQLQLPPSPAPAVRGIVAGNDLVCRRGGLGAVRLGELVSQQLDTSQVGVAVPESYGSHDDLQYEPQL